MYMDSIENSKPASVLMNDTADNSINKESSLSQLATNGKNSSGTSSLSQLRNKMTATPIITNSPATLSSLASLSTQSKTKQTSLSVLSSKANPSSLSSLTNNNNDNNNSNDNNSINKQSAGKSLLSLAKGSADQRNKSALQSLVQRQHNIPSSSSLASIASKKASLSNGSTLSSLSHLANRANQNNNTNKLSSLLSSSTSTGLTSSLSKAEKKLNVSTKEIITKNDVINSTSEKEEKEKGKKENVFLDQMAAIYNKDITVKTKIMNPLIAPPSPAAMFLFKPHEKIQSSSLSSDIFMTLPRTLAQAFHDTMSTSVTPATKLFNFDVPSPDDIVLTAQSQRSGQGKKSDQ